MLCPSGEGRGRGEAINIHDVGIPPRILNYQSQNYHSGFTFHHMIWAAGLHDGSLRNPGMQRTRSAAPIRPASS